MTTLRAQAVAAYQASEADRTSDARAALGGVLAPFDPATLTVADATSTPGFTLFVFTDGDISLGVRSTGKGWTVHLVEDQDGWTELAAITSLADLGHALPTHAPPASAPEWVQPTGAGDAYPMDALVTHNGKTWVSLNAANVWKPPTLWREA